MLISNSEYNPQASDDPDLQLHPLPCAAEDTKQMKRMLANSNFGDKMPFVAKNASKEELSDTW